MAKKKLSYLDVSCSTAHVIGARNKVFLGKNCVLTNVTTKATPCKHFGKKEKCYMAGAMYERGAGMESPRYRGKYFKSR